MTKKFIFTTNSFVLFIIILLCGCNENRLDVNVSSVEVKLDIKHFETDLFENKIDNYLFAKKKYGYFIDDYTQGILGIPGDSITAFNQLMALKNNANMQKVYQQVNEKYRNFKPYENELIDAYKHFKFYFPNEKIPTIITFTSNFSFYMNPVGEGYIGISLDMHMGADYKIYDYVNIEKYWRKILTPQTIVTNHMLAHCNDMFGSTNLHNTLTDEMVYYGKLLYFLDATTPKVADEVKIGMTKAELDWCKQEESSIWAFLVKEKYLYETESKKYEKLINEGPKTILSGVPDGSPAMLGRYIGWMIVRTYMSENTDITLPELMKNNNAKGILQQSGYKPQ
ncbi:MAG: hypothetical protein PSX81_14385 [bacterium]|nr:hypothetical protein [bacterium]